LLHSIVCATSPPCFKMVKVSADWRYSTAFRWPKPLPQALNSKLKAGPSPATPGIDFPFRLRWARHLFCEVLADVRQEHPTSVCPTEPLKAAVVPCLHSPIYRLPVNTANRRPGDRAPSPSIWVPPAHRSPSPGGSAVRTHTPEWLPWAWAPCP
jgi:hypothetical protein